MGGDECGRGNRVKSKVYLEVVDLNAVDWGGDMTGGVTLLPS